MITFSVIPGAIVLLIMSIVFFAFFSGDKVSIYAKIVSIIAALGLVTLFWMPFKNILRFSEGHKSEFEILFLKKIRFSKILKFRNKVKAEKMVRAWSSFWSEKTDFNERDFTKIFIHHIDDSIKHKKFELAIQLAQTYVHNVDKRDGFLVSYEILPKVFEWNEKLWSEQQAWSKNYKLEKRIQNFFPQKYFTAVGSWLLKMYKKINPYKDHFWKWNYFGADFFKELVKVLLKDRHNPYQLFLSFKTHAEESVNKLNKIEDKKEKQEYDRYITGLFSSFCPIFFSEVGNAPSAHEIWDHYFPEEWKISMTNRKSEVSRIILHEFLQWSRDRIFKNDDNLTEAISGIFQNVHPSLFTSFLMLFFSEEIKNAVGKEPNFYILGTSVSWVSSAGEAEEDEGKRITELMNAKSESQKEETIGIILNFFTPHWDKLKITLERTAVNFIRPFWCGRTSIHLQHF